MLSENEALENLNKFIKQYEETQEKYKDDEIQAEIERSCYFEEVPYLEIKTLLNSLNEFKKENEEKDKQINQALDIAFKYGQIDGEHHKAWVIDQIVKALAGKEYDKWINNYIYDEETGDSYTWDKGIAP